MASSEQSRETDAGTSSNAADDTHSNQLLYKFDAGKPWQYFTRVPQSEVQWKEENEKKEKNYKRCTCQEKGKL